MKKIITTLLMVSLTGCSLIQSSTQPVTVVPSNQNAQIYVDGNMIGKGPQTVQLKRNATHSIMAKCPKSAGVAGIDKSLSTTGMLDIVGGLIFLIPFVGLLSPGAYDLSPTSLSVAIPDETSCSS